MSKKAMLHTILTGLALVTMQATYTNNEWVLRPYVPAQDDNFIKHIIISTEKIMASSEEVIKSKFGQDYKNLIFLHEPRLFGRSIENIHAIKEASVEKNLLDSFVLEYNGIQVAVVACCNHYELMQHTKQDGPYLLYVDFLMAPFNKSLALLIFQQGLSKLSAIKNHDTSIAGLILSPDPDDFCNFEFDDNFGLTDGNFDKDYFNRFQTLLKHIGFQSIEWAVPHVSGGTFFVLPFNKKAVGLVNDIMHDLCI